MTPVHGVLGALAPSVAPAGPAFRDGRCGDLGARGALRGGTEPACAVPFRAVFARAALCAHARDPWVVAPRSPSLGRREARSREVAATLERSEPDETPRGRSRSAGATLDRCERWQPPPSAIVAPPVVAERVFAADPSVRCAQLSPVFEQLMTSLVRRVAWSGDARRGTARLEIGAGALAGATLVVHADAGRVRVHLDVPSGVDARAWRERIAAGLAARGIATDEIHVT